MKRKMYFAIAFVLIFTLACGFLGSSTTSPGDNPQGGLFSQQQTCQPDKWKVQPRAVEDKDNGDGTKYVKVDMGVQNNDKLWGEVSWTTSAQYGPYKNIVLTMSDGSTYNGEPELVLIDQAKYLAVSNQFLSTALIPPGFSSIGQTWYGDTINYMFAFKVPSSAMESSIAIGGLQVMCVLAHSVNDGKTSYSGATIDLPSKTYSLSTDLHDVGGTPSATNFPKLVGSSINIDPGVINFTGVSQNGDKIDVTFDYVAAPDETLNINTGFGAFNGFVIGNSRYTTCSLQDGSDCRRQNIFWKSVSGQIGHGVFEFQIPPGEQDLKFVYVRGDVRDLNKVFNLNP